MTSVADIKNREVARGKYVLSTFFTTGPSLRLSVVDRVIDRICLAPAGRGGWDRSSFTRRNCGP